MKEIIIIGCPSMGKSSLINAIKHSDLNLPEIGLVITDKFDERALLFETIARTELVQIQELKDKVDFEFNGLSNRAKMRKLERDAKKRKANKRF